jgi:hypothetical protein
VVEVLLRRAGTHAEEVQEPRLGLVEPVAVPQAGRGVEHAALLNPLVELGHRAASIH